MTLLYQLSWLNQKPWLNHGIWCNHSWAMVSIWNYTCDMTDLAGILMNRLWIWALTGNRRGLLLFEELSYRVENMSTDIKRYGNFQPNKPPEHISAFGNWFVTVANPVVFNMHDCLTRVFSTYASQWGKFASAWWEKIMHASLFPFPYVDSFPYGKVSQGSSWYGRRKKWICR